LALAEPVTAWVLAVTVVGEALSTPKVLGALLIFLGLALVSISAMRPNTRPNAATG
jgi:DME family drug/metabolite transporter